MNNLGADLLELAQVSTCTGFAHLQSRENRRTCCLLAQETAQNPAVFPMVSLKVDEIFGRSSFSLAIALFLEKHSA